MMAPMEADALRCRGDITLFEKLKNDRHVKRALIKGNERPSPDLTLKLFSWSRYAEISADRHGAYCTEDNDAASQKRRSPFSRNSSVGDPFPTNSTRPRSPATSITALPR